MVDLGRLMCQGERINRLMKINLPFESEFVTIFPAPNADKIVDLMDFHINKNELHNENFKWGEYCKCDRILLSWRELHPLLEPSLNILFQELNKDVKVNYSIYDPWISAYKPGYFQEVHCHHGHDISCVFFANNGDNFGKFFFLDRQTNGYSEQYCKLMSYSNIKRPIIKAGDIMFFSSDLFHGVSSHENDIVRKTLSTNFDIVEIK